MGRISLELGMVTLMLGCASSSARTETVSPNEVTAPPPTPRVEQNAGIMSAEDEAVTASPAEQDTNGATTIDAPALTALLPTACQNPKECTPPLEFARAACHGRYPSMALAMFEKHTPWQRLYLKAVTLEAVNAYGERSTASPMVFGEEVIVLRGATPAASGKLLVSSSDIDVLRWDGTCATVARELFSTTPMPKMVQPVQWRFLEDAFQETLLTSKYVAITFERQRSACKVSDTSDDTKCQKAQERLSEAIGVAVRGGIALPTPAKLPKWASADAPQGQGSLAIAHNAPH